MWLAAAVLIGGCVSTPTGYTRDAPTAVYPAGKLSGDETYFVGWRIRW